MSEKNIRILFVSLFLAAAIASTGCRSRGVGLNTMVPSDGVTPRSVASLPFFGQNPVPGTVTAEPNGFTEYGNKTGPSGGSAIPIDIDPPATQINTGPRNLPTKRFWIQAPVPSQTNDSRCEKIPCWPEAPLRVVRDLAASAWTFCHATIPKPPTFSITGGIGGAKRSKRSFPSRPPLFRE